MKKLIIISMLFPMLSCGIKKDLATAQQEKVEIQKRLKELEKEQANLEKQNQELTLQNQEYRRRVAQLLREQEAQKNKEINYNKIRIERVPPPPRDDGIFSVVEKMPQFPGGEAKMFVYLARYIKYPQAAKEAKISGKVYVQFVVEKNGSISEAKVIRGLGSGCDQEALRVVRRMPIWVPGEQRGKKVRVKYVLPINFVLR